MTASLTSIPGQRQDAGTPIFPLAYRCESADVQPAEMLAWVSLQQDELVERAAEHGAVLFRAFPIVTDQDFDQFVAAFHLPCFRYADSLSNAVRIVRTERVFTANEAPADVRICLHHEMAQTPVFPSRLFFFCEQAAGEGGETPLCRSDVLFAQIQRLLPQFADDCRTKGLKYSHIMPPANDPASGMGRSWQSTFRADSAEQAEARLRRLKYSWTWQANGCLKVTTPVLPAVRTLTNGRKVFFNQLIAAFQGWKDARNDPAQAVTFGDGTPLDPAVMQQVIQLAEELTFKLAWQNGDVVLVDNYVTMHGRMPFHGTRSVLASLVAGPESNEPSLSASVD